MNAPEPKGLASVWQFDNVSFDEATLELRVDGQVVALERKPLEVLRVLLRQAGQLVTKDELLAAVWPDVVVVEDVLTVAVAKLRRALGDREAQVIVTVRGYGYRFAARVVHSTPKPEDPVSERLDLAAGQQAPRREAWQLERHLGRGAYGDVWVAVHAQTQARRVFKYALDGTSLTALKREVTLFRLLKATYGEAPEFVQAFEWNLETPPYFVEFEYGGENLLTWAAGRLQSGSWPLDARIDLARAIAAAVAKAHAAGIVHRDLKPANILVDDSSGTIRVRLTDFGVGSVNRQELLDARHISRLGFTSSDASTMQGTAMYAAPEVIAGQTAGTTSDIYALGVILYQLAVGDFSRGITPGWEADINDPVLIADIAEAAHGRPEQRMATAHELERRLATITARRQAHAETASLAISRARMEAALARQAARRPWVIATAITLSGALLVCAVMLLRERSAVVAATHARTIAEAINNFVKDDLVSSADPKQGGNPSILLKDALIRASGKLESRYANSPELMLALRRALGRMFVGISDNRHAAEQFAAGLALARQEQAPALDIAVWQTDLSESQLWIGEQQNGETNAREALAALVQQAGPNAADTLRAQFVVAKIPYLKGDSPSAEKLFADLLPRLDSPSVPAVFRRQVLFFWATIQLNLERYAEGARILQALSAEPVPDQEPPQFISSLHYTLGVSLNGMRRYAEAERTLKDARAETAALLGERHLATLAVDSELARLALNRQNWQAAAAEYSRLASTYRDILGDRHPLVIDVETYRALAISNLGRRDEAMGLLTELSARSDAALGTGNPSSLVAHWELAYLQARYGSLAEAVSAMSRLETDAAGAFPPDGQWTPRMLLLKARILLRKGRRDEAHDTVRPAIDLLAKYLDPNDPVLIDAKSI